MPNLPGAPAESALTVVRPALDDPTLHERWERLRLSLAPDPLMTLAYAKAVGAAFGLTPHVYLAENREGRAQGGIIVLEKRKGPFRAAIVPPFTSYSTCILPSRESAADIHGRTSVQERLLEAIEPDFHQMRLHLPPDVTDTRPLVWRGWRVSPFYTYRIALREGADLMTGWSESTRRRYRNARDTYTFAETPGDADALIGLNRAAYERRGRSYPVPATALRDLIRRLHDNDLVRIFSVRQGDNPFPEAAVAVLADRHTAYYWVAGSLPGDAMTVLLGHLLPRLRSEGVAVFDFVGANTPSIAEFKRKFGARLTPYYAAERIDHPALKLFASLKRR